MKTGEFSNAIFGENYSAADKGGASGTGAAVWPPAIVNDVRRAIHVAFNLVALFMRQPLFGS